VHDHTGTLIAGDEDLPAPRARLRTDQPSVYDSSFKRQLVRVAALSVACGGARCQIEVAETTNKRGKLTRDILLGTLLPQVALAALAFTAIWFGVGRALQPLTRLSSEIETRSPRELSAVDTSETPEEAKPLVGALNTLFGKLRESGLAQQRFLATAAHQLRTPLAGLKAETELALLETHPSEMHDKLERLNQSAARASRLATQLLALARSEPDAQRVDALETVDLRALIQEQIDEWVRAAAAKDIDLGFELQPARVQGQAILLRELQRNLIHNALEYTPHQGRVTVRCGTEGDRCFFAVEDNGPGIPRELRESVLERFYRMPETPGTGSGLGLAIVQEIALAHRARIEISGAGGGGTLVRVAFPAGGVG
jgi:two-component system, OmpR family, sensor histidine kinase TctE